MLYILLHNSETKYRMFYSSCSDLWCAVILFYEFKRIESSSYRKTEMKINRRHRHGQTDTQWADGPRCKMMRFLGDYPIEWRRIGGQPRNRAYSIMKEKASSHLDENFRDALNGWHRKFDLAWASCLISIFSRKTLAGISSSPWRTDHQYLFALCMTGASQGDVISHSVNCSRTKRLIYAADRRLLWIIICLGMSSFVVCLCSGMYLSLSLGTCILFSSNIP